MNQGPPGQIITFYSYKGGVGRSMALANVATRLAQSGKKVLAIDFDLEAPGLHRYFVRESRSSSEVATEKGQRREPIGRGGVIELFYAIRARLEGLGTESGSPAAGAEAPIPAVDAAATAIAEVLARGDYVRGVEVDDPNSGAPALLSLIAAGRFDETYPERVRDFGWQALHDDFPEAIRLIGEELTKHYDYVLIDSRTGTTDAGNICTVLFPEKLVLVFAPNEQSLHGALEVGRQAVELRKSSADLRPLPLFPLISRVENAEDALQREWIARARDRFERAFQTIYGVSGSLSTYFDAIQIPHRSFYAYGEHIACERERVTESRALASAFHLFVAVLESNNAIDAQSALAARLSSPLAPQARGPGAPPGTHERVTVAEKRAPRVQDENDTLPRAPTASARKVVLLAITMGCGAALFMAWFSRLHRAPVDPTKSVVQDVHALPTPVFEAGATGTVGAAADAVPRLFQDGSSAERLGLELGATGTSAPSDFDGVPAPGASGTGLSARAASLIHAVANAIETGSPDQNSFMEAMASGRAKAIADKGSLYQILQRYVHEGDSRADTVRPYLVRADQGDKTLVADPGLRKLLGELAGDPDIARLSASFLDDGYWTPALRQAARLGVVTPLGIALLFDTRVQSPVLAEQLATETSKIEGRTPAGKGNDEPNEKAWVAAFINLRRDPSRQEFTKMVRDDNWDLDKPITIKGQPLWMK